MRKQVLKISLMGLCLAGSLTFAGCGSNSGSESGGKEEKQQHEGHDHNGEGHNHEEGQDHGEMDKGEQSAYICPMECEGSASEEAGQCPECGMDLVKRSELEEK